MNFEPVEKKQMKIKKLRKKYDKNFRLFKYIQYVSTILFVLSVAWMIVSDAIDDAPLLFILQACLMSVNFILPIAMAALVSSMTGTRVTDAFSETLEIRDGYLIHAYNHSLGGGTLEGVEGDNREYDFSPLDKNTNITVDERTGRLEIASLGRRVRTVCGERVLYDFTNDKISVKVMYDYFEPSLIAELDKMGLISEKKAIEYRLDETPEEYRGWKGDKKLREDVKSGKAVVLR
jgi:hypothetical protein